MILPFWISKWFENDRFKIGVNSSFIWAIIHGDSTQIVLSAYLVCIYYVVIQKCKHIANFIWQQRYMVNIMKNLQCFEKNVNKQLKSADFFLESENFEKNSVLGDNIK